MGPQSKDGVSLETFRAAVDRIQKLEGILREIEAIENVRHLDDSQRVAIMASLARSVLS